MTYTVPGIDRERFLEGFRAGDVETIDEATKAHDDGLKAVYELFDKGEFRTLSLTTQTGRNWKHVRVLHKSTRRGELYQLSFYFEQEDGEILPVRHAVVDGFRKFAEEFAGMDSTTGWSLQ